LSQVFKAVLGFAQFMVPDEGEFVVKVGVAVADDRRWLLGEGQFAGLLEALNQLLAKDKDIAR